MNLAFTGPMNTRCLEVTDWYDISQIKININSISLPGYSSWQNYFAYTLYHGK